MKILNTYPPKRKYGIGRSLVNKWAKWPFLLALYVLPIVNILTGWPAWSVVAIWGMWMVWSSIFSPQLIEYNRISNAVRFIVYSAVLLVLINYLIVPFGALEIVAIVGFSGVILLGVLFFSNLNKQKQNLMPLLFFLFFALALSIVGLILWRENTPWPVITLTTTGVALLISFGIVLRKDLLREFAKRFHVR